MSNENQPPADRKTLEQRHAMTDLERLRHSCAHVMANAIVKLWPDAQFAAGPPVEQGFYYDVELAHRITPDDFPAIEAEMKAIIKANQPFERVVVTREQALDDARRGRLAALGDRPVPSKFKIGNLEDIPEGEAISYYKNGDFIDLCAGPHVRRTGNIGAFKLNSVASAYYKGDENNPQLQRVYGIAFKNKSQLDEWLEMQEEAKKRDHRKIGAEMGLYVIDPDYTGPGMPLWLPNGTVLVEELEKLAKETEFAAGYRRVRTPHLAREKMYRTSGHLPYYAESMFPPMELAEQGGGHGSSSGPSDALSEPVSGADDSRPNQPHADRYYLKAMNCPHHHRIFAAAPRSYRDLPLRLAEYGCCYRYEQSGELFGLMRVRSLNMNDAHIYCTEDQFAQEFNAVNDMYLKYFRIFGIEKYVMRFSTHGKEGLGKKYVNEPALWVKTEEMVRQVLIDSKINYIEVPNEAAFYGPKIDVQVWSVIGREFTLATNQVDFAVPAKFGLTYRDRDNTDKTPLCIHRAPLGTHERFIGFLIEHYAGNFPLWLAPEQARVLPVTEAQIDYARGIVDELRAQQVRAEFEFSNDKLMGRIQRAEAARVHHILVVGGREREANAVAVRIHGKGQQGVRPRSEVIAEMLESIRERRS
ncbi:MAG: threonine--tRNA ligase [Verrucomicrobia bacterium]|nr:threonine--tRNA ligase [Verrucomicrobiota bacterium]NMD20637.1 threonine--tRNA ligase [Verrucomicrobiota bacterium]HNU98513.1 threonine--tRNA ligase [Verrucomicrobiota bacterium]HOA61995.1 threonine--tRNA ligase [Verrucomicrobiota bacterium]HOF49437.1 threonine--tRNA ligase [Verrucomicrobiota bacterium]